MMGTIMAVVESMRPKQWIKNLLIFAPVAFAQRLLDPPYLFVSAAAFAAFCLASSGVYVLNDLIDRDADRLHPEKKDRPIASGRLSPGVALFSIMLLFAGGVAVAAAINWYVLIIVLGYFALNLSYTFALKKLVIIDAFSIAIGFVLRMLAGGAALKSLDSDIRISTWIILCTLLGSLFLAFCKRRNELGLEGDAVNHRATLGHYSTRFLDQMIAISTACTVMAYALWTMWPETVDKFGENLFWTIPFVCYGIFRYLYLVHRKNLGGSPSKVFLSDAPLIINIFLWFGTVVAILYNNRISVQM